MIFDQNLCDCFHLFCSGFCCSISIKMKWVVVKFLASENEEIEVVPYSWLKDEEKCFWPPFKKTALERAIKLCVEPSSETWEICKCKIISKIYEKFSLATAAASKAQYTSDIDEQSANDAAALPGKRRIIKNPRFIQSDNSSGDENNIQDEDSSSYELPEFPMIRKNNINKNIHQSLEIIANEDLRTTVDVCTKRVVLQPSKINQPQLQQKSDDLEKNGSSDKVMNKSNVENNASSFEDDTVQTKIVRLLIKNNNLLKHLSQELDTVNEKLNNLMKTDIIVPNPDGKKIEEIINKLPIKTMEEITELENQLQAPDIYKALAVKLSHIGGENYKEAIRRIMSKVLTNDLAKSFSWIGHKGKKAFAKLNLAKTIVEAVELIDQKNTLKHIEEGIAKWLAKAGERAKRAHEGD